MGFDSRNPVRRGQVQGQQLREMAEQVSTALASHYLAGAGFTYSGAGGEAVIMEDASDQEGGGTVNSFAANNFDPLFTVTVTDPTTTPVLSFTAIDQAPHLFYAGPSGDSDPDAAPTFREIIAADLPVASFTDSGIVSTGTQTFGGTKEFVGSVSVDGNFSCLGKFFMAEELLSWSGAQIDINLASTSSLFFLVDLNANLTLHSINTNIIDLITYSTVPVFFFTNTSSFTLTVAHNSSSGTADYRIYCPGATDLSIGQHETFGLYYDDQTASHTLLKWRVFTVASRLIANITGTLPVSKGGTGVASWPLNCVLLTNLSSGTGNFDTASPGGSTNFFLASQGGSKPAFIDGTEFVQDTVGAMVPDTDTINATYVDATGQLSLVVITQMSVTSDSGGVKLVNDANTPGNNKVYGTDGGGSKGWQDFTTAVGSALAVQSFSLGGTITSLVNPGVPQWYRATVLESAFTAAATSETVNLVVVPAGVRCHDSKIKHSTSFTGSTLSSFTLELGVTGSTTAISGAFNVFQATGALTYATQYSAAGAPQTTQFFSHTGTTQVTVTARSIGANVSAATAGTAEVWLLLSAVP